MPEYNAGNAYLTIVPSFRGIEKMMQRETAKLAREIDKAIGNGVGDGMVRAVKAAEKESGRGGQAAGDKFATAFETQMSRRLKGAADAMPDVQVRANLSQFDRAIVRARRQLNEMAGQKIGVGGDTDLDTMAIALEQMETRLRRLQDQTKNPDQWLNLRDALGQVGMLGGMVEQARTQGRTYGGAFAEGAKARITQALKALPEVRVDANSAPAERAVAELRHRLEELGEKKVGVDIDRDSFLEDLQFLGAQLRDLAENSSTVTLKYDLEQAARSLREFGEKVAPTISEGMEESGDEAAERWSGAYVDGVQRRLGDAIRQIPNIPMTVDNTDAERKLAAIRVSMEDLADRRIGVDIDAGAAEAQVEALLARLRDLDSEDVDIDVRTNAAAAAASLSLVRAGADDSSMSLLDLGRQATITMSRIGYMIAVGSTIGALIAPAAATAAAAIIGLGTAGIVAAAGIGVFSAGVSGIGDAVKAMDAQEQDAAKSARSFSQAQNRVAGAADQVKSAEEGLANTRAQNAEQAFAAAQRIRDAERDVAKARREAGQALQRATEQQVDAERDLARVNGDAREAREGLNRALREAVFDLRNLDTAVKRNAVEVDKATTASMKAKEELDRILANPRATEVERRLARDAYNDRIVQIEELKNRGVELRDEQKRLAKEGVEGTDRVTRARKTLANADERVADAQRRLAKSRGQVRDAQIDGAERVAAAERRVADANRAQAAQARQGAAQIAAGQRQIAAAQRQMAQAYEGLGAAGGESLNKLKEAMDKLSPAGQRFARFIHGLKPALRSIRDAAQEGLLPGLESGIQQLVDKYLPAFRSFVKDVGKGLGDIFAATPKVLENPTFQRFFGYIRQTAVPAMQTLWAASMDFARGLVAIFNAFTPLNKPMGQGLLNMASRFAAWSEKLEQNPAFQELLEYVQRVAPKVVHLIGQIATFIGKLVIAAAPVGEVVLDVFIGIAEWLASWKLGSLFALVVVMGTLGTVILGLTGLIRGIKFVTEAYNAVMLLSAKAHAIFAASMSRFGISIGGVSGKVGAVGAEVIAAGRGADTAGRRFGAFGRAMGGLRGIASKVGGMLGAGGILGIGLAAVTLGISYFSQKSAEQEGKVDSLSDALLGLGNKYKEVGSAGRVAGSDGAKAVEELVKGNPDLEKAVIALDAVGVSLDEISKIAEGDTAAALKVINDEIARMDANKGDAGSPGRRESDEAKEWRARREQWVLYGKTIAETGAKSKTTSDALRILRNEQNLVGQASLALTPLQDALAKSQEIVASKTATAQEKTTALYDAEKALRDARVEAIESSESFEASIDTLTTSVTRNKDENVKDAKSLSEKTEQGRNNRDMLENMIDSAGRMYDADVNLNGATQESTDKYEDNKNKIRAVAEKLGLSKDRTNELIEAYSRVKPLDMEFKEHGFPALLEKMRMTQFIQFQLSQGVTPEQIEKMWKAAENERKGHNLRGFAQGGEIYGPGTKTSDDVIIAASRGEFMQQADAVDYYGTPFMHALNKRLIPKDALPGFAHGGLIGDFLSGEYAGGGPIRVHLPVDFSKTKIPDLIAAGIAGSADLNGWMALKKTIESAVSGMSVASDYRPGDPGYHGKGRAIDMVFSDGSERHGGGKALQAFNYIASNYGKGTRELIWDFSPWGLSTGIWNGDRHRFNSASSGPGSHNDHIHWAYDQGGMLPPGYSTVFNGTGKPEPVLTSPQWDAMFAAAINGGVGGGDTYNIEFAENKLTLPQLEAHQQRRDTLARVGRRNR